jgi:protein-disulfide isomerase
MDAIQQQRGGVMAKLISKLMRMAILAALLMAAGFANATPSYDGSVIAGPDNAPIVIEEYMDFYCTYCRMGADVMRKILKNYPDKVRLVFRNLPLQSHGSSAITAAKVFTAIWLQSPSLAYSFQEQLFDHQNDLFKQGNFFLYVVASRVGADLNKMRFDIRGADVARILDEDRRAAATHNFNSTPSFVIGSEIVTGARPYNEIKAIIDRQLGR